MFTCPVCKRVSHHPDDERFSFCGACDDFTGAAQPNMPDYERAAEARKVIEGLSQMLRNPKESGP